MARGVSLAGNPVWFVNAFADGFYAGNTAAVVLVEGYPPEAAMLDLAREFGFSETAFVQRLGPAEYQIRWFTPEVEVPLCGHATLASAKSLFDSCEASAELLTLHSLSGPLIARRKGDLIELDFPSDIPQPHIAEPEVLQALGPVNPMEVLRARGTRNLVLVYERPQAVLELHPDFTALTALTDLSWFGIAVTAPGTAQDYICRYFAPWEGINEDPVTGSAQTFLAPYWSGKLGRKVLSGFQASERGGAFEVEVLENRVLIRGHAWIYLRGELAAGWRD